MGQEKSKKSHTGRNVTITALLLAALLGGGHYGLGIGKGGGGEGLLPESGNSTQSETAQTQQAEESAAPQEAQEPESPAEEAPEADDGVLSIVVKEDKILYEGEETELAALEQALLRDYVQGKTTVTLTDDHAIKSAYDEVTALLERLGIAEE